MHTEHEGISSSWKTLICPDEKYWVEYFIWENRDVMMTVIKTAYPNLEGRNFIGHCCTYWVQHYFTKERKSGPKFAEIHLSIPDMRIGLAAHEIQHLVHYWSHFKWLNTERDDEMIADLVERLSDQFWIDFYERYDIDTKLATITKLSKLEEQNASR